MLKTKLKQKGKGIKTLEISISKISVDDAFIYQSIDSKQPE